MMFTKKKTRALSALCALMMLVSLLTCFALPAGAATTDVVNGEIVSETGLYDASALPDIKNGLLDDAKAYKITDRAGMNKLADLVNFEAKTFAGYTFYQMADIDMGTAPFEGIGIVSVKTKSTFSGTFDGNGFVITNLFVYGVQSSGLFGNSSGATFKNVGIASGLVAGGFFAAAISGYSANTSFINCWVASTTIGGSRSSGCASSISGSTGAGCKFYNCYNLGLVCSGIYFAAGMAGKADATIEFKNSYNAGDLRYSYYNAGATGYLYTALYRVSTQSAADVETAGTANSFYRNTLGYDHYNTDRARAPMAFADGTVAAELNAGATADTDVNTLGAVDGYTVAYANVDGYDYPVLTYSKNGEVAVRRLPHTSANINGDSAAWMGASDVYARFLPSYNGGYINVGTVTVDSADDLYLLGLIWQGWNNPGSDYDITKVDITADIDMKDVTLPNIPRDANGVPYCFPLGGTSNQTSQNYGFANVVLEGNGHTIYNWNVYSPNNGDVGNSGLVGQINGGTVRNINLVGAKVTRWHDINDYSTREEGKRDVSVGLLVGAAYGSATVMNCTVSGTVYYMNSVNETVEKSTVGGLIGNAQMPAFNISDSWCDANVVMADGSTFKAGPVGYVRGTAAVAMERITNVMYAATEKPSVLNANMDLALANSMVKVSGSGEFAYLLTQMGKGTYTLTKDGHVAPGTASQVPAPFRTIMAIRGEEAAELSSIYYVPGSKVTAPDYEGFVMDRSTLPAGTDETNTFVMPGKEVVVQYNNTVVNLLPVNNVSEKLQKYDLDLFVDSDPAKVAIADAKDLVDSYGPLEGQPSADLAIINDEILDLVKLANNLDLQLVNTYPNYVPYSQRDLYEQFGKTTDYAIGTKDDWFEAINEGRDDETFAGITLHLVDSIDLEYAEIMPLPILEGTLNGHGHAFENLNLAVTTNGAPVGMISVLLGTVRDVGVASGAVNVFYNVDLDDYGVAALIGHAGPSAKVLQAWNAADVSVVSLKAPAYENPVAGLVGYADAGAVLDSCYNVGTIFGGDLVSDLVNGEATVYNSFGAGTLLCTYGMSGYVVGGYEKGGAANGLKNVYGVGDKLMSKDAAFAGKILEEDAYYTGEVGYLINQNYVRTDLVERNWFTMKDGLLALADNTDPNTLDEQKAVQLRKVAVALNDGTTEYLYVAGNAETVLDILFVSGYVLKDDSKDLASLSGDVLTVKPVTDADYTRVINMTATVNPLDYTELTENLFYFLLKDSAHFENAEAIDALVEKVMNAEYTTQAAVDADAKALADLMVYVKDVTKLPAIGEAFLYEDAPGYTINNGDDLEYLAVLGMYLPAEQTVYLNADINLSGVNFAGIQDMVASFDGLGHTVANFVADHSFFMNYAGASLKNVNFENAQVADAAVLVNATAGDVTIDGISVLNSTGVAALVGTATGKLTVKNSEAVDYTVNANATTGLLIGNAGDAAVVINNVGVFGALGNAVAAVATLGTGTVTASNVFTGNNKMAALFNGTVAVTNAKTYGNNGYTSVDAMNTALVDATAKWNMNGKTGYPALVLAGKQEKHTITFEKDGNAVATGYTDINGNLYQPDTTILNGYWDVKGDITNVIFTEDTTVVAMVLGNITVNPVGVAKPGDFVKVEVGFDNNPGLKGATFNVNLDFDKFSVIDVEGTGLFRYFMGYNTGAAAPIAPFKVIVANPTVVTANDAAFVLTLKVKDTVGFGNYPDAVTISTMDVIDENKNVTAYADGKCAIVVEGDDFLWGDVNKSNSVLSDDAVLVMQDTVGLATPTMTQPAAGELDGKAGLTVVDAQMILWHLAHPGSILKPVGSKNSTSHLQNAGVAFSVKAGETVWFGPTAASQADMLVFTGATSGADTIGVAGVTEVSSFGGNYKIYSYTAPEAGTVMVNASANYADRFLISLGQKMTTEDYYAYWSKQDGINLYDGVLDHTSETVDWKGAITSSVSYNLTHAINVTEGDVLTIGPASTAQVVLGYAFDASGKAVELINAVNMTEGESFAKGLKVYSYKVPAGVESVRVNVPASMIGKYLVMKNKVFGVADYTAQTGISNAAVADALFNKAGLFAGDSINHGLYSHDTMATQTQPGGWALRVQRDTGLAATNAGTSGWYFCNATTDKYDSIHKLLDKYTANDYQYVLLQGGTNDASKISGIGTITDSFDPATFDQSTFTGALEYTIYKAIKLYGDNAAIGFMSTYKLKADTTKHAQMYAAAEEVCEKWGIAYLDLYNNEDLNNALNMSDIGTIYEKNTKDGTHANANGYELITPYVIEYMRDMVPCSAEVLNAVLG